MEQLSPISLPDASHRYWHSVIFSKLSNISNIFRDHIFHSTTSN
jgi:hypothetical protein